MRTCVKRRGNCAPKSSALATRGLALHRDVSWSATGDAYELVEGRWEDVVRVAARRPHLVELREVGVDDRAQGSGMADRRDAADGFCNP